MNVSSQGYDYLVAFKVFALKPEGEGEEKLLKPGGQQEQ